MISETRELRWFFATPPPQISRWRGTPEHRTDWYAPIADAGTSVKLREGLLETKCLMEEQEIESPLPLRGSQQRWTKVGQKLSASDAACLQDLAATHWLTIEKRRSVRHFLPHQIDSHSRPQQAAQVEWTEVTLMGNRRWTFCVEVAADQSSDCAARVVGMILDELGIDAASLPKTSSYPAWILGYLFPGYGLARQGSYDLLIVE